MRVASRRVGGREARGAVAVEFALVLPILLVVLFGIINFGVVLAQQLSISNAARQAARFAVVDVESRACGDIETEAREAVPTVGLENIDPTFALNGATGPCERPCEGSTDPTDLTVVMTYRSDFVVPMPIPGFPTGVDLTGEGTFRCEYT